MLYCYGITLAFEYETHRIMIKRRRHKWMLQPNRHWITHTRNKGQKFLNCTLIMHIWLVPLYHQFFIIHFFSFPLNLYTWTKILNHNESVIVFGISVGLRLLVPVWNRNYYVMQFIVAEYKWNGFKIKKHEKRNNLYIV